MSDADVLIPVQAVDEARTLLGPLDSNARLIRELHGVSVLARDGSLRLLGDQTHVQVVQQVLEECLGQMRAGRRLSTQEVASRLRATLGLDAAPDAAGGDRTAPQQAPAAAMVKARTAGQARYLE